MLPTCPHVPNCNRSFGKRTIKISICLNVIDHFVCFQQVSFRKAFGSLNGKPKGRQKTLVRRCGARVVPQVERRMNGWALWSSTRERAVQLLSQLFCRWFMSVRKCCQQISVTNFLQLLSIRLGNQHCRLMLLHHQRLCPELAKIIAR